MILISHWYLYLLRCADNSLYTGISTNLERRLKEHRGELAGGRGAKYTAAKSPVELVYSYPLNNRSEASRYEYCVKRLSKSNKELLVSEQLDLKEYCKLDER